MEAVANKAVVLRADQEDLPANNIQVAEYNLEMMETSFCIGMDNNDTMQAVEPVVNEKMNEYKSPAAPTSIVAPSNINNKKVDEILICPISLSQMQDPVCLVPSGHTYDKKSICDWILIHPYQDPMSQQSYNTPMMFADNISLRQLLMAQYGDTAYIKYDDTEFQKQFLLKWGAIHPSDSQASQQIHGYGHGMTHSQPFAAEWSHLEADQTNADAQFALGNRYRDGDGVSQSYEAAVEWYRRAALQGHADAQVSLGDMYDVGDGVTQSDEIAAEWYRRAADQGNTDGQWNLGCFYESGEGAAQCFELAVEWFRRAALQGHTKAQFSYGSMFMYGLGVTQSYITSLEWYRRAADKGHAKAQFSLGSMYDHGDGVEQNLAMAAEWYRRAAEQGYSKAQYNLATMYKNGEGVKQSYEMAVEWCRHAAVQGCASSQSMLVTCMRKVMV
jgi:TPR repeat protein